MDDELEPLKMGGPRARMECQVRANRQSISEPPSSAGPAPLELAKRPCESSCIRAQSQHKAIPDLGVAGAITLQYSFTGANIARGRAAIAALWGEQPTEGTMMAFRSLLPFLPFVVIESQ
jgi:hypothetical protein